jgi:hypothetical protein
MKERAKQLKASGQWKKPEKPAQTAPGEAKPKKEKEKKKDQEKTTKDKKRKSDASAQVCAYSASSFTPF